MAKWLLEGADKTKKKTIRFIGNKQNFEEKFDGNVYDLIRGDTPLRVYGAFDSKTNEFFIFEFDFNHSSRL